MVLNLLLEVDKESKFLIQFLNLSSQWNISNFSNQPSSEDYDFAFDLNKDV